MSLLLLWTPRVEGDGPPTEDPWNFRPFLTPEGGTFGLVRDVLESMDGTIWVATSGDGVFRVRGTEWKTYDASSGLPSNEALCLEEGGDGRIWVGTAAGLCRLGDSLEVFTTANTPELRSDSIRSLRRGFDGRIWAGTRDGFIFYFDAAAERAWTCSATPEETGGRGVRHISRGETAGAWAAVGEGGLLRFDGRDWRRVGDESGLPSCCYFVYQDRRGTTWASGEDSLFRIDGEAVSQVQTVAETIRCLAESPKGEWLYGSLGGARSKEIGGWKPLRFPLSTGSPAVEAIHFSRDGASLWLGTRKGLLRGSKFPWRQHSRVACGSFLSSIAFHTSPDSPPTVLASEKEVLRFEGRSWRSISKLSHEDCEPFARTAPVDGKCWTLSSNHADQVSLQTGRVLRTVRTPSGSIPKYLFLTSTAEVWLLTETGVYALAGSEWLPRRPGPEASVAEVLAVDEAPDGAFYVCYRDAVERWVGDRAESLVSEYASLRGRDFRAVRCTRDGRIWLGTYDHGIFVCDGTSVQRVSREDGLASERVSFIYEAADGTIWVGYDEGLVGSCRDGRWLNFSHNHGLPNARVRYISEAPDGAVWVATGKRGLYRYEAGRAAPDTFMVGVVNNLPSHGVGVFSFSGFDAWNETAREELEFSWCITPVGAEGDSTSWSSFSKDTSVVTSDLSPGTYELQVRAADLDRNVDPTPHTVPFRVAPPTWQTAVFLIPVFVLLAVVAVLACIGYGKHRSLLASASELQDVNRSLKEEIAERQREKIERTKLEERLRRSQKIEALGRTAGGVAHGFNNLLTVINGHAELLVRSLGEESRLRANAEQIRKAGARAAGLSRQLLAFSRRQVLALQVHNLKSVVHDTEDLLRSLIGERIELITVFAPESQYVRVDVDQLTQVIINVCVNARDAMPGGGKLTIETTSVIVHDNACVPKGEIAPGPCVVLQVADTGLGMNKETLARIFDPFFTTKAAAEGSGLGLSTAFGIVKQCGGDITISSAPGQGTQCRIWLPRVAEPAARTLADSTPSPPLTGSETILLVEDERIVRNLVCEVLRSGGYTVLDAESPQAGIEISREHEGSIDILVTDVVMPGMNGKELADRLRPHREEMRVLFLSGYAAGSATQLGLAESTTNFLQKPFSPNALLGKVREVLSQLPEQEPDRAYARGQVHDPRKSPTTRTEA